MSKTYKIALSVLKKYGNLTAIAAKWDNLPTTATREEKINSKNKLIRALKNSDEIGLQKLRDMLKDETIYSIVLLSDSDIKDYIKYNN